MQSFLVNGVFLELPAAYIVDVADCQEGIRIKLLDDQLQLGFFQTGDDAENDFLVISGITTLPFK